MLALQPRGRVLVLALRPRGRVLVLALKPRGRVREGAGVGVTTSMAQ